ncbi:O-methyltransferase [Lacicoccus alkaliphilus]|uniref:Predicted O-methyltransferase YrrM n=1 Tax=Lacicoccus alkaliphilus DSM 16010 TaxID=1123231 RepID=A0A1M7BPK3_9BACL|nr:O-methyltransferase [Salinicoccus alkaliphilus]SHL56890.1 Predicted O-methyltransferase YrrM [Salinicoccus alkaliphilus DSM 16010]
MDLAQYVKTLNTGHESYPDILSYAVEKNVPVIDSDALAALKHLIRIKAAKTYLEIGTAIGYSGLHMLSVYDDSRLITIEKDEASYETAVENFSKYKVGSRVDAHLDDAKTIDLNLDEASVDMLFIDASKGNNQLFFDKFSPFVKEDGLIVVDNILLRGLVIDDGITGRNKRKLKEKVDAFNQNMSKSNYPTSFLPVGDGLLVISKSQV